MAVSESESSREDADGTIGVSQPYLPVGDDTFAFRS